MHNGFILKIIERVSFDFILWPDKTTCFICCAKTEEPYTTDFNGLAGEGCSPYLKKVV